MEDYVILELKILDVNQIKSKIEENKIKEGIRKAKEELEYKIQISNLIIDFVEYVNQLIKKEVESGSSYLYITETVRDYDKFLPLYRDEAFEQLQEIFAKSGYKIKLYEYSQSWYSKSGKWATLDISFLE